MSAARASKKSGWMLALILLIALALWISLSLANRRTAVQGQALAEEYLIGGRLDEAVALLEGAVANGAGEDARILLAQAYLKKQEGSKALGALAPLLKRKDPPAKALCAAAQVHHALGRADQAVAYARRAVAADPVDPQNYLVQADLEGGEDPARAEEILLGGLGMVKSELLEKALDEARARMLPAPSILPEGGEFPGALEVLIGFSGAADAQIYYTTDGTAPTEQSALYQGGFRIAKSMTVRAVAIRGGIAGRQASANFTITNQSLLPIKQGDTPLTMELWPLKPPEGAAEGADAIIVDNADMLDLYMSREAARALLGEPESALPVAEFEDVELWNYAFGQLVFRDGELIRLRIAANTDKIVLHGLRVGQDKRQAMELLTAAGQGGGAMNWTQSEDALSVRIDAPGYLTSTPVVQAEEWTLYFADGKLYMMEKKIVEETTEE